MKEKRIRSLIKAITWRILASLITGLIVLAITHERNMAIGAGFADAVIKIVVYYVHERIWARVSIGRPAGIENAT
jgi:adenylylsulfate kinase